MGDGDFLMIRKKIEQQKFLWHMMILCVYKEDSLGINWEKNQKDIYRFNIPQVTGNQASLASSGG